MNRTVIIGILLVSILASIVLFSRDTAHQPKIHTVQSELRVPTEQSAPTAPREQKNDRITVTPLALVEDSRCPANANCIQAGTVRVRALVQGSTSQEVVLTLGKPQIVLGKEILLTNVSPERTQDQVITFEEYHFTFSVK